MIQKLRKKIILVITIILWAALFSILIAVNVSNYQMNNAKVNRVLNNLEEAYSKTAWRDTLDDAYHLKNKGNDSNYFRAVKVYSAYVNSLGTITVLSGNNSGEVELEEVVTEILKQSKTEGKVKQYLYRITDYEEGTFVAFADNSIALQQFKEVLLISSILGVAGMVILFFVAFFLSGWLVRPVKNAFERQKQFISDASHELKTPIAVIGANAEMLCQHPEEEKYHTYIQQEIQKMNHLLREMLSMASMDAQPPKIVQEKINISRLIEGSCLPFESIAFEQGHPFVIDIQKDVWMEGNEEEIARVIGILIDNAVKYARPSGKIEVKLEQKKGKTIIGVRNEGSPIPEEEQSRIFERFYRMDKARNRSQGSFGLGLAIAKTIVERHKGRIYVVSDVDHNTFYVQFQSSFKERFL